MNDMGWILWSGMPYSLIWQGLAIAIVIFRDKRDVPLLPRWVGYFNVFFTVTLLPEILLIFFKGGPFAWNGLLTFWVAIIAYVAWTIIMSITVIRASYGIEQEDAEAGRHAESESLRRVELLNVEVAALRNELGENNRRLAT